MTNLNSNPYTNTRIEYHILQSFPVTCLNRDDVGAPKTAIVGGVTRARVSSQCWKRQVRLALQEFGVVTGIRTKQLGKLVAEACIKISKDELDESKKCTEDQAKKCGAVIESAFVKEKKGKKSADDEIELPQDGEDNDTLLFWSPNEIEEIAKAFKDRGFDEVGFFTGKRDKWAGQLAEVVGKPKKGDHVNALDIALFGRMVAKAAVMNVEAAASFAHAISTHKVSNEVEFFTALDDRPEEQGSAHMGSMEFNSATYYRYISLDLGQLVQTLGETDLKQAIAAFTKALFLAKPNARQTTMSGAGDWDFARVIVRKGQRLQLSFEEPVKLQGSESGYLQPSIEELKRQLDKKEKLAGSLFGKQATYDWGENEGFSIDDLIGALQSHVQ